MTTWRPSARSSPPSSRARRARSPRWSFSSKWLIERGHAYAADGHVLFDVPSDPNYGCLSHRNRDEMVAGARVEVAPYKQDPADFVLWKPSSPEQPGWDSPWGRGRPGWHIECSAMSAKHLGETFDIHGGGQDLIFPHHENEIAQSSCGTDGGFARLWMHNGYVVVGGEKMSKSLGNFFTVRQLLEEGFRGEAIRLALLSGHYRQPLDITREKITEAKAQLDRLYGALRPHGAISVGAGRAGDELLMALEDDLNTPQAIAKLHEWASTLNKTEDPGAAKPLRRPSSAAARSSACWNRTRRPGSRAPRRTAFPTALRTTRSRPLIAARSTAARQEQGLRRSRPHPRRSGGPGRPAGRRRRGHDLEARLSRCNEESTTETQRILSSKFK